MAFNQPAPAPAFGAAAPATGFNFGTSTAPATTPAPTTAGFAFGGAASASAAPALTFGSTTPAAPATAAPAPATGGFGFAPATSGTNSTPAPAPVAGSTTFGATPAASGSAPSTLFGATSTTLPAASPASSSSTTTTVVQDFDHAFPYPSILSKVKRLLAAVVANGSNNNNKTNTLEAQELCHILQCQPSNNTDDDKSIVGHLLCQPPSLTFTNRNDAFRAQLQANPTVLLWEKTTAGLTNEMMQEIWALADDLRISEESALCLYAQASDPKQRKRLESHLTTSTTTTSTLGTNVPRAARELFFYQHACALTTVLLLLQERIHVLSAQDNNSDTSTTMPPHAILVATDQLIQNGLAEHLIALVRNYTNLANQLEQEWAHKKANTPQTSHTTSTSSTTVDKGFLSELVHFVQEQRQVACECLFYFVYPTQCTSQEVASLIDLIKDLTNGNNQATGLPILDPDHDIPSAYHVSSTAAAAGPFGAPLLPSLKDPLQWQHEWVQHTWENGGGKPQLLQCVSVLITTVLCALDARQTLLDRNTHRPNAFGVGNALHPPSQDNGPSSTDELLPIHSRLDPKTETHKDWKRKDIWGLLTSSYALLLLPVEAVVCVSPRSRSSESPSVSPRRGRIDVKTTWRACLEAPTQMKSFSFARLSLIPSFAKHNNNNSHHGAANESSSKCHNYEFYMSVLSEFVSQYLNVLCASGNVPISREQWKSDEEMELQVNRAQRDQTRRFGAWSGSFSKTDDEPVLPDEVDLLERPDCMDDVMALAVTVCSTGSTFAYNFWTISDEPVRDGGDTTMSHRRPTLVPSRALQTMERLQAKDRSLLPAFVSFLGALALAHSPREEEEGSSKTITGADVIHQKLSTDLGDTNKLSWYSILHDIRWFAKQLNSSAAAAAGRRGSTTETLRSNSSSGGITDATSTAYYYGADQGNEGSSNHASSQSQQTSSSSAAAETKPAELGEHNTSILLSHLDLISSVASRSAEARRAIASIQLPVADGVGEDPFLTILFSLAIAPVSPQVRGAVFVTISNVLREEQPSSSKDNQTMQEMARKGWDLLEESQIVPIALLDQYAPSTPVSQTPGMAFPPSSTALVSTVAAEQRGTPWTTPDTRFGILYEMEHVEAQKGAYPATEGLLHLLTSLVMVGGCPADLGRFWRARSGCSPYIEYVIHFVLPRALGTRNHDKGLPFCNAGDKSRLVCLALEVVEAVLSRYVVPTPPGKVSQSLKPPMTSTVFGLGSVAKAVSIQPSDADEKTYAVDYRDEVVSSQRNAAPISDSVGGSLLNPGGVPMQSQYAPSTASLTGDGTLPLPKSPGFAVLVDILSSLSGDLFRSIVSVLTQDFASRGMVALYGNPEFDAIVTSALFGRTPPTFDSAKKASNQTQPSLPNKQALLTPPFPANYQPARLSADEEGHAGTIDGTYWRERSVAHALRILCAAAIRENHFSKIVNGLRHPLKVVPVLRFHKLNGRPAGIHAYDVQVSRLVDLLNSSAGVWNPQGAGGVGVFPTIVEYIGYVSPSWKQDAEVASPAVALMLYVDRMLPSLETARSLCGASPNGDVLLAAAVARRLRESSQRVEAAAHADVVRVVLDLLVSNLRVNSAGDDVNISQLLLGLPTPVTAANWDGSPVDACADSLDVILELLSGIDFVRDSRTSNFAAKCYEIVYYLVRTHGIDRSKRLNRVLYACQRLRSIDFWYRNLSLFLEKGEQQYSVLKEATENSDESGSDVLHCVAWLLKGVANELRLLMGISIPTNDGHFPSQLSAIASPRPTLCRRLLSLLFAAPNFVLAHALNDLPLVRKSGMSSLSLPSNELTTEVVPLQGPADVVSGYFIISIDKLEQRMGGHKASVDTQKSAVEWAKEWNLVVTRDCAVSHLADSLRVVMGSSFVFCRNLLLDGFWDETTYGKAPMDSGGVLQFLSLILSRLIDELPKGSNSRGVNDALYSKSALELAKTAVLLVEEITKSNDSMRHSLDHGDTLRLYTQLSKAVALSPNVDGPISHQVERTVLLGKCLAMISEAVFKIPDGLQSYDGERDSLVRAAAALARIACRPVNGSSRTDWTARGDRHASMIRTARSCLSTILVCHESDASPREESLVFKLFKMGPGGPDRAENTSMQSFLSLVATMDDDIYNIISSIAICRFGTELLQEAGLLASLAQAAERYAVEEGQVREQMSFSNQNVGIRTPSFLLGHYSLLNTMLSTRSLLPEQRHKLACDAKDVIRWHVSIIGRLIVSFPADADVLLEFTKCLYLVSKPRDFENQSGGQSLWQLESVKSQSAAEQRNWAALEKLVLDLTYHISQYPFPQRMLPALPGALKDIEDNQEHPTHVVSVSKTVSRIWWDAIESQFLSNERVPLPEPPRIMPSTVVWYNDVPDLNNAGGWSDQHYEFSIQTTRILDASLSYLNQRVMLSPPLRIDCVALAKGFCRCADAARAIEGRLRTLLGATSGSIVTEGVLNISMAGNEESNQSKLIEQEYLAILGPLIGRCAEKFLVLTLAFLRSFARDSLAGCELIGSANEPRNPVTGLSVAMLASLDHTQVESMGIGCIGFEKGEEKRRDFAKEISKNLRKELQGEMKRFT